MHAPSSEGVPAHYGGVPSLGSGATSCHGAVGQRMQQVLGAFHPRQVVPEVLVVQVGAPAAGAYPSRGGPARSSRKSLLPTTPAYSAT